MYCMHCGEQIPDNSRFCKYCGKLVAEDEIRTVKSGSKNETESETLQSDIFEIKEDSISQVSESAAEENESFAENLLNAAKEKTEKDLNVEIVDDYLFEHISGGKKAVLFISAVFITAVVAVVVFACFFPELI